MKKQINSTINAQLPRGACYLLLLLAVCAIPFALAQQRSILTGKASHPAALGLTFAERVAYETAIEDVYWRHRIWPDTNPGPKPGLDKVMSQADIEKKVTEYLRNSQALETYWQRPITADQLQAEMERMASYTRQPGVLQELFEALGNDPFVVAECLARPILAERLVREQSEVTSGRDGSPSRPLRSARPAVAPYQANAAYTLPAIASPSSDCIDDTWTATTLANAPSPRNRHVAVWTGSEIIVWGGDFSDGTTHYLNTGGRYNPSTDSWTATSTINAPDPRFDHTAVWTGSEMIVWGGYISFPSGTVNTGGRYNPSTDSWTATATKHAPSARETHTAVWTGSEMIIWGGHSFDGTNDYYLNTGGRYNPSTDRWTATNTINAPTGRTQHRTVWTDSEMIVWGGWDGSTAFNTGGRYNPSTNSWTATSTTGAPAARQAHTTVWTGSEMIVWSGDAGNMCCYLNTGGRYNPGSDSWTATSTINAPTPRRGSRAAWTGSEMIAWGGYDGAAVGTGGRYNPVTDTWTVTSLIDAPSARFFYSLLWTGSEMIVWGGANTSNVHFDTGGRYCAVGPSPTPTPTATATATPTATPTPTAAPTPAAPTALTATNVTTNSFAANWSSVGAATGYRLDLATDSSFTTYVPGYQDLDVGNTTSRNVTGLTANTFYYYRVRAYNANGTSPNSNVITVKTKPH